MTGRYQNSIRSLAVIIAFCLFPQQQASAGLLSDLLNLLLNPPQTQGNKSSSNQSSKVPTPTPPPKNCNSSPYDVIYKARTSCSWPFAGGFQENSFWRWFDDSESHDWSGRQIYFDHLDKNKTSSAHLDQITLSFRAVIFDYEDWDLDHIQLSMNGYDGVALSQDAVEFKEIEHHKIKTRADLRHWQNEANRYEDHYHYKCGRRKVPRSSRNDVQVIELTFHLEKFVFGVKKSAADLLRKSAQDKGTVHFGVRHAHTIFRLADGRLELKGELPGSCPTPTPTPKPTPAPTPTPKPTPTPTPTPTPAAPVVSITSASVGALTNLTNIQVNFTSDVPASFECSFDGSPYAACASPASTSGLSDGIHHFSVRGSNAGGTSSPAVFDWTVDATSPVVTLGAVNPPDRQTHQTQILIPFSANETATFECRMDSGAFAACVSPLTANDLGDGQHVFAVHATDLAGNMSRDVTYMWSVKTIPPTVMITQVDPANNPSNSTSRSFTFVGSADTSSYKCAMDGASPAACTSPYTASNLVDGGHQFSVWGVDAVGNQSVPAMSAFTIDTMAPVVAFTSVPAAPVLNTSSITVAFSADESANFSCTVDGTTSACLSPLNLTGISDGSHVLVVRATDAAGNVSDPATYNWAVDTTAPVISLVKADPSGALINQTSIGLVFTASETVTATCSLDGQSATNCSAMTVSYDSLSDGNHAITIVGTDTAGNMSQPFAYNFAIDTTKPTMSIDSVDPSAPLTNSLSLKATFSANKPIVQARCQLDAGAYAVCTSPMTWTGLTVGTHTIRVMGTDKAGNVSAAPATYTWTVDNIAPKTMLLTEIPPYSSSSTATFEFTASESSTFECVLDGVSEGACISPVSFNGLANGGHTFTVYATDLAGNRDNVGASASWTIDTTPLSVSNFVLTPGRTTITVTWTSNIPSTSIVTYSGAGSGTVTDNNFVTSHSVVISNLSPFVLYNVQATSVSHTGQSASTPVTPVRTQR